MDAPPAGDFCHCILSANFSLQPLIPTVKARSASLENIAWIPGGRRARTSRPPKRDATSRMESA